jgi:hypothetical protein
MNNNIKKKNTMRKEKLLKDISKNINQIIIYGQLLLQWVNFLNNLKSRYKIRLIFKILLRMIKLAIFKVLKATIYKEINMDLILIKIGIKINKCYQIAC